PVERGSDACVVHLDRESEARHGVPIGVRADDPQVEARIADAGHGDVLAGAESSAVDDRVIVAGLAIPGVYLGRTVGHPEVLVARARRPGCGQLQLTTIDVDRIGDEAERDLVATAEDVRTGGLAAARICGSADAIVEVAAEVIAGPGPGRLDI